MTKNKENKEIEN